jgi:hypothetical protein
MTAVINVTTTRAVVICAAPPHRCALHRRRRWSLAPLLLIAAPGIVAGGGHAPALPSPDPVGRLIALVSSTGKRSSDVVISLTDFAWER